MDLKTGGMIREWELSRVELQKLCCSKKIISVMKTMKVRLE
jgi:hypothetical protein